MLEWREPSGPYISRSAAAYPDDLNQLIADTWVAGCVVSKFRRSQTNSMVRTGYWSNTLVATHLLRATPSVQPSAPVTTPGTPIVCGDGTFLAPTIGGMCSPPPPLGANHHPGHVFGKSVRHTGMPNVLQPTPLRPQPTAVLDPLYNPSTCVGGLVDVWTSVQRVPGHFVVGASISAIMDTFFDANPRVEEEILHSIGRDDVDPLHMESLVDNLRDEIARSLASPGETVDQNRVNTAFYDTNVRAHLLYAWLAKANDPGLPICRWLWAGAPAGLTADFSCLDGLFPRVDAEEAELDPNELVTDFDTFVNYQGIEADDDVFNVLKGYRKRGFF